MNRLVTSGCVLACAFICSFAYAGNAMRVQGAVEERAKEEKAVVKHKPGEERTFDGIQFVWIPAGEFTMGSPESEKGRGNDEGPVHMVRITKGFWLGRHEVTQAQYERVIGANPSHIKGGNRPVECVSWNDAVEFCRRLSSERSTTYRLPTEAEWEYACRAGTTASFYWGDCSDESVMKQYCWYDKNANEKYWTDPHADRAGTQPVGLKKPNALGLYDMSGNVWEWCSDWFSKEYYASSPRSDPTGPSGGMARVERGGGWGRDARHCRSADRPRRGPDYRDRYLGFRICRCE